MIKLLIFPTPLDALCELTLDNGTKLTGKSDVHSSGRLGQSFNIPGGSPDGHGCELVVTADKKVKLSQRGILYFSLLEYPVIVADDFHLTDEKNCPEPSPIPPTPEPPSSLDDPLEVINDVWNTGQHELLTKEGCGKFTEACVTALHNKLSGNFGHLKKSGAQNQYNGHAVDAVNLRFGYTNPDMIVQPAGIYDIIKSSESLDAKPAFNKVEGETNDSNWYYPA